MFDPLPPFWMMLLRLLPFLVCVATEESISYILEDFDNLAEFDDISYDATNTTLFLSNTYTLPYSGDGFLRTQSSLVALLRSDPNRHTYNCGGANRFSLRYRWKAAEYVADAKIELRFTAFKPGCDPSTNVDDDCITTYASTTEDLQRNHDWEEVAWGLGDDNNTTWFHPNATSFYPKYILGWEIRVQNAPNATSEDFIDFDHLACHGEGDLLTSLFMAKVPQINFEERKSNWQAYAFKSELSERETQILLPGDGVMSIDYVVQQTENWGGSTSVSFETYGYFNLSKATELAFDYEITRVASPSGYVTLRFIIDEVFLACDSCGQSFRERYYSFHHILEHRTTGPTSVYIPLVGSSDHESPFWYTGWSGGVDDKVLDRSRLKQFTWELSASDQLGLNNTAEGSVEISNFRSTTRPLVGQKSSCPQEVELTLTSNGWDHLRFLVSSNTCCERCMNDDQCLFSFQSVRRNCGFATEISPVLGQELRLFHGGELERTRDHSIISWVNSGVKTENYCYICECVPTKRFIDCRGKGLRTIPQLFDETWLPKKLDLRDNPGLSIVGSDAFAVIFSELEDILFPANIRYLAKGAIDPGTTLRTIELPSWNILNVQNPVTGLFGDVCCEAGSEVELKSVSLCGEHT